MKVVGFGIFGEIDLEVVDFICREEVFKGEVFEVVDLGVFDEESLVGFGIFGGIFFIAIFFLFYKWKRLFKVF